MDKYKIFNNKTVLITGGTGSFGTTFLKRLSNDFLFKEVRIFSRDEKKQDDLRKNYSNPKLIFFCISIFNSFVGLKSKAFFH